ncbi:hypothetical protein GCM10022225_34820 [Plantactinospora mayteni]|uniref:Secreted protein n=1 Tax=Plantactinospora mayteni TaxID=566021 RepID=A0ABQ4EMP1_9ACTN|nr:hypothetical protein [Plantactinospora mayteni]GIG95909.1 hypothetical protein Pma05_24820 [Plantactinospora mayteni]
MSRPARPVLAVLGGFVAAAVAVAWAPAVPAVADPPGLVNVGVNSARNSSDKAVTASCPAGKVVTGGGGYLAVSQSAWGHVGIERLEPLAGGTGFGVTMREAGDDDFLDDWAVTGQAICAPAPAGWQVVSATGPAQTQYVTVSCGTKRVIGAGGRINSGGAGAVLLDQAVPSADLRSVTARGVVVAGANPPPAWSVTAYAVCATNPAGLERISGSAGPDALGHASFSQSCPAGKALYGVGADINAGNGWVLLSGLNVIDEDSTSTWADEYQGGPPNAWSLTGYGICGS